MNCDEGCKSSAYLYAHKEQFFLMLSGAKGLKIAIKSHQFTGTVLPHQEWDACESNDVRADEKRPNEH